MRSTVIEDGEVATEVTTDRSDRRILLARVFLGVFLLGIVGDIVIATLDAKLTGRGMFAEGPLSDLGSWVGFVMFPIVGYVLAIRRPDNAIGRVMLGPHRRDPGDVPDPASSDFSCDGSSRPRASWRSCTPSCCSSRSTRPGAGQRRLAG